MTELSLFEVDETQRIPEPPRPSASPEAFRGFPRSIPGDDNSAGYGTLGRPWGLQSQQCAWCKEIKAVGEFFRNPGSGWLTRECRTCAEERLECWAEVEARGGSLARNAENPSATHKVCSTCGRSRPKGLFYRYRPSGSGSIQYRARCKQCEYAKNAGRQRSIEGQARDRDRYLRKNYGIGLTEYENLFLAQSGRCAICGSTEPGGPTATAAFHVDHCHATGRVRGLLCRACNTALGLLKESPDLFAAAARYLRAPLSDDAARYVPEAAA